MIKESKADKILISKLQSGNQSRIYEALKELKETGSVAVIPYLFDLISENTNEILENDIINIISDIKDKKAVPLIVDSIQRQKYGKRTADVIAICWQSRLDFSSYLAVFTNLFLSNDYQISLEAFTVIEESVYNADVGKRKECLSILNKNASLINKEIKPLFNELNKIIKSSLDFTIDNQRNTS